MAAAVITELGRQRDRILCQRRLESVSSGLKEISCLNKQNRVIKKTRVDVM